METLAGNALYKVVRGYKQLEVADKRDIIERQIHDTIVEQLAKENLKGHIIVGAVTAKSIKPNQAILDSATAVVRAENELKVKQTEVAIAEKEAARMKALSENSQQSVAYMDAEARRMMAQAMLAGKVNTVVVPYDFKGIVSVK
jgi:regulator of protease activity HflC (stomatin/prohibitin superfamily)